MKDLIISKTKQNQQTLKLKGLPIETNWNLIWLKSKNLSNVAKAFKEHILVNKEEIIQSQFGKNHNSDKY